MPDYVAGFVVGVCTAAVAMVAVIVAVVFASEIAEFWRWLGHGLRDVGRALAGIIQPSPIVLPRWVQRTLERIKR